MNGAVYLRDALLFTLSSYKNMGIFHNTDRSNIKTGKGKHYFHTEHNSHVELTASRYHQDQKLSWIQRVLTIYMDKDSQNKNSK